MYMDVCSQRIRYIYRHKVENVKQSTRDIFNIMWLELFIVLQATNQSIDRQSIIESIYIYVYSTFNVVSMCL